MKEIKCNTCGFTLKIENLLSKRCPRCGSQIAEECFACSGNCLTCHTNLKVEDNKRTVN